MSMQVIIRILVPGLLLQSVVIGGGYATGRELVEFFLEVGPASGLLGMIVATMMFSLIAMLCFEFARVTATYNYRDFFRKLIGPFWVVYEVAYFLLAVLVLAVIGAAAGEMVQTHLGIAPLFGTVLLLCFIAYLVFKGSALIARVLATWSVVLYLVFGAFVFMYLSRFGDDLAASLASPELSPEGALSGLVYVGYNIVAMPAILFCARRMHSRTEAITAGLLTGPLTMIPAFFLYLALLASYPEVLAEVIPTDFMMRQLDVTWLLGVFLVVIFGTFIETGTAYIHAINERLDSSFRDAGRSLPGWLRVVVALISLSLAMVLANTFGVIQLIAKGYAALTWVFIFVFILPLCTLGAWRIARASAINASDSAASKLSSWGT